MPSQNGWPLSRHIVSRRVPGSRRDLWLNASAAPMLLYVARRFHDEVAAIDRGQLDDWGYARPTRIPGSRTYSNHGSGTAIDLNAAHYPWGRRTMSAVHRRRVRAIVTATRGAIRWGGDYHTTVDEMHFEVNVSPLALRAISDRMRLRSNGTQFPRVHLERVLGPGMRGPDVAALRRRMGLRTGRTWGPVLSRRVRAWRRARGMSDRPVVGSTMAVRLGWVWK